LVIYLMAVIRHEFHADRAAARIIENAEDERINARGGIGG